MYDFKRNVSDPSNRSEYRLQYIRNVQAGEYTSARFYTVSKTLKKQQQALQLHYCIEPQNSRQNGQ